MKIIIVRLFIQNVHNYVTLRLNNHFFFLKGRTIVSHKIEYFGPV